MRIFNHHTWIEYEKSYSKNILRYMKNFSQHTSLLLNTLSDIFFIHSVYKQISHKKIVFFSWLVQRKYIPLQPILRKFIKIAAMQRLKFNILGGLNIQSTWCLECDSYMHTSGIVALRFSLKETFHIARGRSVLLPT